MGKPDLVHDPTRPAAQNAVRVGKQLQHQTVANQIGRVQADRLVQLQQLTGPPVGRLEVPPVRETQQTFVETARSRGVGDAQSDMGESYPRTGNSTLQRVSGAS